MRNLWIYISSLAVVAVVGGAVYDFLSKSQTYVRSPNVSMPHMPQVAPSVLAEPAGNPLLTANFGQFERWVPRYPLRCGEILFEQADSDARHHSLCIDEIRRRVAAYTMQDLSRADVLDPRVRSRWHQVMEDS